MRGLTLFIACLIMAACSADKNVTKTNQDKTSQSVKDVNFRGPTADCAEIKKVLASPPNDMTKKQILEAELSLDACSMPIDGITVEDVRLVLNENKIAYEIDDEIITVYAKHTSEEAITCCSLQPQLKLIGKLGEDYLFAYRFYLKGLDSSRLEFMAPDFMETQDAEKASYIGPNATPDRAFHKEELDGHLTTETFKSTALGEKRIYDVYVPPNFDPNHEAGLVILGDGGWLGHLVREWEPLIADGSLGNFVAIGVRSGQRAIVDPEKDYDFDVRNSDYIHAYTNGPQRFDKHLSFVADELIPHVIADLNITTKPEKTVLMGGSSAGSFALWGVMKRPDVFGVSVGMSPSGPIPDEISKLASRRTYFISAGLYEPSFRRNAVLYNEILSQSGARTNYKTYPDGHSSDHRAQRVFEVLPVLFPNE